MFDAPPVPLSVAVTRGKLHSDEMTSASSGLELAYTVKRVRLSRPFMISRDVQAERDVVWVQLRDRDGTEGWGEAAPSEYYGETPQTVVAALEFLKPLIVACDPWDLESFERRIGSAIGGNGSAKAAVSAALHDLTGKRLGVPVTQLLGLSRGANLFSSFTIGISGDDELRVKVREAAPYPILKVKLGTQRDRDIIRVIREEAPDKALRVDANCAWTPKHAVMMTGFLADHGVEFIEQPTPPDDLDGLRFVRENGALMVIADEACKVASDIPRIVGKADGINIKLAKCGSLREAIRMIAVARAHGLAVMVGCMIETSLGITAAAQLAPLIDFADLDGAALLADDPFAGATIEKGLIRLPEGPGLGVTLLPK